MVFKYQIHPDIIINLLKYLHFTKMISTETYFPRYMTYQSDSKSEASTEGQENCDFRYSENFLFASINSNDSKTAKSKVKSSLCKNFTEKGFCPYGQKCQFAHGTHELRINYDVNNSYKTKPCNAFFKKGHCQYGYRCNFVHKDCPQMSDQCKWKKIYTSNRDIFQSINQSPESRLLKLLE